MSTSSSQSASPSPSPSPSPTLPPGTALLTIKKVWADPVEDQLFRDTNIEVLPVESNISVASFNIRLMRPIAGSGECDNAASFSQGCTLDVGLSPAGTSSTYKVTEELQPPRWIATFGGDCQTDGFVTLAPGEHKTCVITNTQLEQGDTLSGTAVLTVEKVWADPTENLFFDNTSIRLVEVEAGSLTLADFNLQLVRPIAGGESCDDDADRDQGCTLDVGVTPDAGKPRSTYQLTEESQPSHWLATFSGDCSTDGFVELARGEHKTCVVTNTQLEQGDLSGTAVLTVEKVWADPTENLFFDNTSIRLVEVEAGSLALADFNLQLMRPIAGGESCDDDADRSQGCTVDVGLTPARRQSAWSYQLTETGQPAGWVATFSGDCTTSGRVVIGRGERKTCVVTNSKSAPTPTPEPIDIPGNINCDDATDVIDVFVILKRVGGFDFEQEPGCPEPGEIVDGTPFGDLDCDEDLNVKDALLLLRIVADLPHDAC